MNVSLSAKVACENAPDGLRRSANKRIAVWQSSRRLYFRLVFTEKSRILSLSFVARFPRTILFHERKLEYVAKNAALLDRKADLSL